MDLALAGFIPLHSYYGMSNVVHDYVPEGSRSLAMLVILVLAVLMLFGLLRLTTSGPGVTAALKRLWRAPLEH
jgi:hypothetical protein